MEKSRSLRLTKSLSVRGAEGDCEVRMRRECSLIWLVKLFYAGVDLAYGPGICSIYIVKFLIGVESGLLTEYALAAARQHLMLVQAGLAAAPPRSS